MNDANRGFPLCFWMDDIIWLLFWFYSCEDIIPPASPVFLRVSDIFHVFILCKTRNFFDASNLKLTHMSTLKDKAIIQGNITFFLIFWGKIKNPTFVGFYYEFCWVLSRNSFHILPPFHDFISDSRYCASKRELYVSVWNTVQFEYFRVKRVFFPPVPLCSDKRRSKSEVIHT